MITLRNLFFVGALVMLCGLAPAQPRWQIDAGKSKIEFTAIYNGAPVEGQFARFSADIAFDPDNLNASMITVKIPILSINTNYDERDQTLQMEPWFNAKPYPDAIYISDKISKIGDQTYHVDGKLSIKGIGKPFGFDFHFTEWKIEAAAKTIKAVMQSNFVIQRSDFKIGEGEWADDKVIGNSVKVNLSIVAQRP